MKKYPVGVTLLLLACLSSVLAACTATPPSCYSITDLEQLPEATFRPPYTERVFYRTSDGARFMESPYLGTTIATMGSAVDRTDLIGMYDAYLRPRGWKRIDIDETEVRWKKAGVQIHFWAAQPDDVRTFQTESQKGYHTWYQLMITEPKAKDLNSCEP